MLRALVLILLLLNALVFGWSQGWLDSMLGLRADGEHEPERLQLQAHVERLTLLSPQAVSALQARACLMLAPLPGDEALQAALSALERLGLGTGDWVVQSTAQAGSWAVATHKLGSRELQARKEAIYKQMRLNYEALSVLPDEQPSLVLSRHADETSAQAALESLSKRALKGLRVLQLQAPLNLYSLQLPRADGALQAQLLAATDAALAAGFKRCDDAGAATSAAPASSSGASAPG
jgi:hypothetical protein